MFIKVGNCSKKHVRRMKGEAEGSPNMASSDNSWQKGSVTEESDMLRGRVGNT
jgi:hypothetical protein